MSIDVVLQRGVFQYPGYLNVGINKGIISFGPTANIPFSQSTFNIRSQHLIPQTSSLLVWVAFGTQTWVPYVSLDLKQYLLQLTTFSPSICDSMIRKASSLLKIVRPYFMSKNVKDIVKVIIKQAFQ